MHALPRLLALALLVSATAASAFKVPPPPATAATASADAPATGAKAAPAKDPKKAPTTPKEREGGNNCDSVPTRCGDARDCADAKRALACGVTKLDRDKDGVPCESLCG